MSSEMYQSLEFIDIYLENDYQKVFICRDKISDSFYLFNSIFHKKALEGLRLEDIVRDIDSIVLFEETEESINFLIEYENTLSLQEYVSTNKIRLSKQINYITYILDLLKTLKYLPPYVIESVFNYNNLVVQENGDIRTLGLIILNNDYIDVNNQEIFHNLAQILHIVFGRSQLQQNILSKDIPPDIQRIITKCLNHEYIKYMDLNYDFKTSKVYRLINPEIEESKKVHRIRKKLDRKRRRYNIKKRSVMIVLLAIIVLPLAIYGMNKYILDDNDIKTTNTYNAGNDTHNNNKTSTSPTDDNVTGDIDDVNEDENIYMNNTIETLDDFFNENIKQIFNDESFGIADNSLYYDGTYSILIPDTSYEGEPVFVGAVDLSNEAFSYATDRAINISMWMNSDNATEARITLKLLNNDKVLSNITRKVYVTKNTWTLNSLDIDTINGQYLMIYISPQSKTNIWLDGFEIDILK